MADGKESASGSASAQPAMLPLTSPQTAIVTTPISMATTGMAMGTPTLLTISNGAINIKAASLTTGNGAALKTPGGAPVQAATTVVRGAVPTLTGAFPRLPIFTPQAGVNLRIPHPAGAALNFRVAPRAAVMLNTRALGPGAQILPQVLPQGTKLVAAPHLGNGGQVTQALMAKVKPGQPLQIGMTLPASAAAAAAAAAQGVPISSSTMALTLPLQVTGSVVTAVPAQGTLTSLPVGSALPQTTSCSSAVSLSGACTTMTTLGGAPQVTPSSISNLPQTLLVPVSAPAAAANNNNNNKSKAVVFNAQTPPVSSASSFLPVVAVSTVRSEAGKVALPSVVSASAPANQTDRTSVCSAAKSPSPITAQVTATTAATSAASVSGTQGDAKMAGGVNGGGVSVTETSVKSEKLTEDAERTDAGDVNPAIDGAPTQTEVKAELPPNLEVKEVKEEPHTTMTSTTVHDDVKPSEATSSDNFDPVKVMDWSNGIGSLPGSSLKFRVNEFGLVEMVTDDLENTDNNVEVKEENSPVSPGDTSRPASSNLEQEPIPEPDFEMAHTLTPAAAAALNAAGETDTRLPSSLCQCENCGVYGMINEFCGGGRFCSKTCVGQYAANRRASKKPAEGKLKKSKKRKLMNGDVDFDSKVIKIEDEGPDAQKLLTSKKTKGFSWTTYLEQTKAISAPSKLFKNPFPCSKNGFKVGMKMEGIDPRHPSLYCVLTVAEVRGYRLRLHFDGNSECYDFWTNADSPFIFPVGWVEKNGKKLQPPKGFSSEAFNWGDYLKLSKSQPAPKHLFTNSTATSVTPHGFRVGMKLEAVDKKNTVLTCVATVGDVLGERILIHFDGWEDSYDYWCDPSSPYIHPVGWCQENGRPLSPPNDWPDIAGFTWEDYLEKTKSSPVPPRAFKTRPAHDFEPGMALEAVDRRNPILIRVATVKAVQAHSFLLHFDNWSEIYDYWVDDDCPDNHPCGWCAKTGHPLQPPPSITVDTSGPGGCPTPGCTGIGHIKGAKYTGHYSAFGCPYSGLNMNKETALQDRLGTSRSDSLSDSVGLKLPKGMDCLSPEFKKCPTPNCDGSGHVTGKYTAHHKVSGCPIAEKNAAKLGRPPSVNGDSAPISPTATKPLFGPGSGRGRKKHKLLKQYQQHKESLAAAEYEATGQLHHGIHQSVFMSSMVTPPVKDLPLCWEQHAKLLPGIHKHAMHEVSAWNVHQVADFISSLPGCKDLVRIFLEQQIDGEAFLLLSQADIVNIMSVKLGPALKIYNSILMFKAHCDV